MVKTAKLFLKHLKKEVISTKGLFSYLTFLALLVSCQYLFLHIMPHSFWLSYESIEASAPVFYVEEDVLLVSNTIYGPGRNIDLEWNDILRCSFDGGEYVFFSNQQSQLSNWNPPRSLDGATTQWVYLADVPRTEALCYIDSRITYVFDFGITKSEQVTSNPFTVSEKNILE